MKIKEIKTPEDILLYLNENIDYGYIDSNGEKHIRNSKYIRTLYKICSIKETITNHLGTCIEQVNLIRYLLNKLNIKNKMYVTRIYEPDSFNDNEADEHMHVFIIYFLNGKVYHLEHPNYYNIGIFEYKNEKEALDNILSYYEKLSGGVKRDVNRLYKIPIGLSFKEFNLYLNHLNDKIKIINYNENYKNDAISLLEELQKYIISLDKHHSLKIGENYGKYYFKNLVKLVEQNNGKIYLAVKDKKAIGLIAGIMYAYKKGDEEEYDTSILKGRVLELIVNDKYRASGIGKLLIKKMESYFKKMNYKMIFIEVWEPNKNAQRFYFNNDYEVDTYDLIKII